MNRPFSAFHHEKSTGSIKCPHLSVCPGCTKDNPLLPPSPHLEQAQDFVKKKSLEKLSLQLEVGKAIEWRTRARLAVREYGGVIKCGLYQKRSHTLVAIPHCKVHHPSINEAIRLIEKSLTSLRSKLKGLLIYDEMQHRGLLRYIQCTVERRTQKVQLVLILNSSIVEIEKPSNDSDLILLKSELKNLYEENTSLIHSIWFNSNINKTNVITGDLWNHFIGEEAVWEPLANLEIPFLPFHFEQANLEMFERLVVDMKQYDIHDQETIVELYAGMGVIGLVLKEKASKVISIESSARAHETYQLAVESMPETNRKGLRFIQGDSEIEYKNLLNDNVDIFEHTLIVDPPRKGLSNGLVDLLIDLAMNKKAPTKLIYISCHYPSLERDAERLISEGGWRLASARSYLFFPGTDHIETVFSFTPGYIGTNTL